MLQTLKHVLSWYKYVVRLFFLYYTSKQHFLACIILIYIVRNSVFIYILWHISSICATIFIFESLLNYMTWPVMVDIVCFLLISLWLQQHDLYILLGVIISMYYGVFTVIMLWYSWFDGEENVTQGRMAVCEKSLLRGCPTCKLTQP